MPSTDTSVPPLLLGAGTVPAPFFWRALALLLDVTLASLAAWVILTLPQNYPDAVAIFHKQWDSWYVQANQAQVTGVMPDATVNAEFGELFESGVKTFFLVLLVYFTASELVLGGSTLGKRVFGLRAAQWGRADPPRWIESLSRCIFKTASLVWLPLLVVNVIPMFFRPSRRAAHDYLARTMVTGDAPPPAPPRPYASEED